jgi:hypothetical protein
MQVTYLKRKREIKVLVTQAKRRRRRRRTHVQTNQRITQGGKRKKEDGL